ncbi:hypothetical protein JWV37_09235 [Sulfurospirillum sp. T05]|uniref:Outer membrane beta-barrel protein n=1 Tax=Sulfurospirillum tamanense TaxID=2813362 RepID=A0ABS2WTG6_9BACT|nr:hypothetical protein [Sulfurospirillum tamanensis]MBN2964961.1 hypothetical protein [Sulfurospirillum tamanensis]
MRVISPLIPPLVLLSLSSLSASETVYRFTNDFYIQHNEITGNSPSSSMLTEGFVYHNLFTLYTKGQFEDIDYTLNAGLKLTDDRRKDVKKASLITLAGHIQKGAHQLHLGDFFKSYSKYSLNTSLKGAAYTYTTEQKDTFEVVYGLAYPRWDNFWDNEVDSTEREVLGVRFNKNLSDALSIGIDAVATDDSNSVVTGIPLYETKLYTINSTYRPIPGLKLYGEYSYSDNETQTATATTKRNGTAIFLQAVGNKKPSRVQLEYERISPDFKTVTGSATPDREKFKATWRYMMTDTITMNTGLLWFRDNLDGDKTNTTHTYRPNLGFTFKQVFDRRYAVVDVNYKYNHIDKKTSVTKDSVYDLNYRDRFGIVHSDMQVSYTDYHTNNNTRNQEEWRFNSTFNTRHSYKDLVLKPSIIFGTWDVNDELSNGDNTYTQAALGFGVDIPKHKIATNLRVGKNRSKRDAGDDLDKVFGSFDAHWNMGDRGQFKRIMVYLRAHINDLSYTTSANDYQERSVTLGLRMTF